MDPLFELDLDRAALGSRGSARKLYTQLKAAIVDGRLAPGTKLPPTRGAKAFFGVSRNTAAEAYERLRTDGYVTSRHGSGTYVADIMPVQPRRAPPRADDPADTRLNAFWIEPSVTAAIRYWSEDSRKPAPAATTSAHVDLRPAAVDSGLFPFDVLRRSIVKQLRRIERRLTPLENPPGNQGHLQLREAVSRHIALTRAVPCGRDEIVVTSGAQQAFDLLARILIKPNKTIVAVEDPGYPPMRIPFIAAGGRLVPIEVDSEGLVVDRLPHSVGVICVTPSSQFPLGTPMSKRRRKALVEFARLRNAVIIEDDYDGEFHFDGAPLEALRSSDFSDVVFYVGTFSKCMLSSLRLGFIVAPEWAIPALIAAKNSSDWHSSTPIQLGVSEFIAEGHLSRHVRKLRHIYKNRRELLLTTLHQAFGGWLEPLPSFYGTHVAALARTSIDFEQVACDLAQKGVKIHALGRYFLGPRTKAGLVFGYGGVDLPGIDRGLSVLRNALSAVHG